MMDQSQDKTLLVSKLKKYAYETQRGLYSGKEAERMMNSDIDRFVESLDSWSVDERYEAERSLYRIKWRLLLEATNGKQTIRAPRKGQWIVFYLEDRELCSITVRGSAEDEIKETKNLLAYENGCKPEDIRHEIVWR
jgi:hypothetical protein